MVALPTGYFYIAWAAEGEEFDPDVHDRVDEQVFSFAFAHNEGEFATLELVIKNPRIGLLSPGRPLWVIFSVQAPTGMVCMFRGRLIGVPSNIFDELVTLHFTARPFDYNEQKVALAKTLKVAPYWDTLFVQPDKVDDPDIILESYAAHWHVDPVTHVLTISDIVVGEDGTFDITEDDLLAGSMSLTLGRSPASTINVKCTVPWTQSGEGGFGITGTIASFNMEGLISSWPKPQTSIGGGWSVGDNSSISNAALNMVGQMELPEWLRDPWTAFEVRDNAIVPRMPQPLPKGSIIFEAFITSSSTPNESGGADTSSEITQVFAAVGMGPYSLSFKWKLKREYSETMNFQIKTAMQPIVTMPGEDEQINIELNANKASDLLRTSNGMVEEYDKPIGSLTRNRFFSTDRGKAAVKYLMAVCRAQLLSRARVAEIKVGVPFFTALELEASLRSNMRVFEPRLPSGEAIGKVTGRACGLDGDTGEIFWELTMASTIGYGGAYTSEPGTPDYIDDDYIEQDYQTRSGVKEVLAPGVDDILFTVDEYTPEDDALKVDSLNDSGYAFYDQPVVINPAHTQRSVMASVQRGLAPDGVTRIGVNDTSAVSEAIAKVPTTFQYRLRNLEGGPFNTSVNVTVQDVIVPQQVNLEAGATP